MEVQYQPAIIRLLLFNNTRNHVFPAWEQFSVPNRLYLFIYDLRKLGNQADIKAIKVQTKVLSTGELTVWVMVHGKSGTRGFEVCIYGCGLHLNAS